MGKTEGDRLFINDFIPRVSRTFALAIKFLPPRLRHSVFTAYLLCRVADTIEDSPAIAPAEKRDRLIRLQQMLETARHGKSLVPGEITLLYESIDSGSDHDHRLLAQSGQLFEILGRLPEFQRRIIYRWAGEMAGGMAEFSQIHDGHEGEIVALNDVAQWDRYCYYVAGTVGHMLTDLVIGEYRIDDDKVARLRKLCNSFGLGLQKVNTIKDAPADRERGVVFLPKDLMLKYNLTPVALSDPARSNAIGPLVQELVSIAWAHLDDAIEYTTNVPSHLRGVRMFLTVPVLLASATLVAITRNPVQTMTGPPVKITRRDVARLTAAGGRCSGSNARLGKYYHRLRSQ
jgi:farnesyl-diphosphate farnesyltransferase